MYYKCTKCNAALKTLPATVAVCKCGSNEVQRAERVRTMGEQFNRDEVYRINGTFWTLGKSNLTFQLYGGVRG